MALVKKKYTLWASNF